MSKHPEVLWAQRSSAIVSEKNVIYLTINLPDIDVQSLKYDLTTTKLSFKASTSGGENNYEFDLEFFADVDPEKSTKRLTSRKLFAVIRKKESTSGYWPRLSKEKLRTPFIKTDFEKWADEDEQDGIPGPEEDPEAPVGFPGMGSDFDLSKFSNDFGAGAGHTEGGNNVVEEESDDDGPPPLEDPETVK